MPSITAAPTTTQELLAAPGAGLWYRVWSYQIMGQDTAATVTLKSATNAKATVLTPTTGVGGLSCPPGREPYFDCGANEALNFNSGGATGTFAVNVVYTIMGAI